jgi:hypothetical protein
MAINLNPNFWLVKKNHYIKFWVNREITKFLKYLKIL